MAAEIESVGQSVTRFQPRDQVYGYTGLTFGACAEYKCLPEDSVLAMKPANMSYKEAAAVPNGALITRRKILLETAKRMTSFLASPVSNPLADVKIRSRQTAVIW